MKKHDTRRSVLFGIIAGGVLFFISNVAGMILFCKKSDKKMQNKKDGNNMMYSVALGSKKLDIKPDTDYAYINCINGCVTLTLDSIPIHYDIYIELASVCAKINIKLPAEVNVSAEGIGHFESIKNKMPENTDECLPTVHIIRNHTLFTQILITEA